MQGIINPVKIGDIDVLLNIEIASNYITTIKFTYYGMPYTFKITKWGSHGFAKFASHFHTYKRRDEEMYGSLNAEGGYSGTSNQKVCMVFRGIIDVMKTVNDIVLHQKHCVLSYAVWYCENINYNSKGYQSYITKIACSCIVNTKFISWGIHILDTEFS